MPAFYHFLVDGFTIVLIDLLLAGDNALVIALAVRGLPTSQRRAAIAFGAAAAVLLRIGCTIVAARLLGIEFVRLAGGAFVIWIAIRVLADASSETPETVTPGPFLKAIWYIVFADITMSMDNILAIAGASHGSIGLIIFGLCLSIPFVVASSNLLALLMDRYPLIIYVGAAILGKVGAEMMMTDPFVVRTLHPSQIVLYAVEAAAAGVILIVGYFVCRRARLLREPAGSASR